MVAPVILVADSAPLLRHGLLQALAHADARYQLCEAATAPELLLLIQQIRPTLVLAATTLAEAPAEPLALLHLLREEQPNLLVVLLAEVHSLKADVIRQLHAARVSGLVARNASITEVCSTVQQVLAHGCCPDSCSSDCCQAPHSRSEPPLAFTSRQIEVLRLMAEDRSNEEIARCLFTSVRTVEYHRSQMLQKAGTRTTLGLVLFALQQGILSLDKCAVMLSDK
jgi:DNA-binding NarL/FixJ family response regulator